MGKSSRLRSLEKRFREYVVNANEPVLTLQEQDIVKHSLYFTRLPRPADKSNSQFALNTYSRAIFGVDSLCPCCVILWAHVRTIHGGKRFYRVDQTRWHRHVARAVFRSALQHRTDASCPGDLPRTPPARDEAHALGTDSVLGER